MYRKTFAILLAVLIAVMCLPTLAQAKTKSKVTLPSVELTSVPMLGGTGQVMGKVFLEGQNPDDYVVIAIVGGEWPKPYFDNYKNRLTASGDKAYATFGFSVTTGGEDTTYNTFTLYLCQASQLEGISSSSITDSNMQGRYIQKLVVDKTAFNKQAEPTVPPEPAAASTVNEDTFQVYDDAMVHYGDIAYMGSVDNGNDGSMMIDLNCAEDAHSGSTCIRIIYNPPSASHWAGMMWLSGAGNYPPNLPVDGVDATQVSQLRFYARGQGSTKFFIENDQKQQVTQYVWLTPDWEQYALDVPADWEQICVGFGFASSGEEGESTIYLDDIAYGLF